jgi:AcrR family transcriptional regulator
MGIREENKIKTRQKIIEETKNVLFEKGYLKMSTKDISNKCDVSQGTIFLHFETKERLLNYIIVQLIDEFIDNLKRVQNNDSNGQKFLHETLIVISNYENVLSIAYRDYAHISNVIKKNLDLAESTLKSMYFDNLRNSKGNDVSIVDSFVLIDAFISQIKIYLVNKDLTLHTSIIKQSTGKLNKLYKYLFQ